MKREKGLFESYIPGCCTVFGSGLSLSLIGLFLNTMSMSYINCILKRDPM